MGSKKYIGIITFQKSIFSYGAALQAYAIYRFLQSHSYNVELIDLCTEYRLSLKIGKKYPIFTRRYHLSILKGLIIYHLLHPLKIIRFRSFNNRIKYSKRYRSIDDLYRDPPQYEIYCTGSDQSWNPKLVREPKPYLLTFVKEGAKCISYGSSIGTEVLPKEYSSLYQEALLKYAHISVREKSAKHIIQELTSRSDIEVVLDPTMLLPVEHYLSISKEVLKERYMFCYFLNASRGLLKYAQAIAKHNNLSLVIGGTSKIKGINAKFLSEVGPCEWLGLIKGAAHILTDSFHGTVFAMLLNGNFTTCIVDKERATRIINLLEQFSLSCHLISGFIDLYNINDYMINREKFTERLNRLRSISEKYFISAIEN
ncbi:polysaccharide pyruvyl transferase family protein [Hoylesella pleuritidis]|uniref:Polysaccharide pyruvyl transferase n=1 Tax=Hoylesella pleuritidis F0068 TaxID=1081904 RepID=U2MJ38_9BACT|nr:polysaccharide pyruvyl transferase family protein [Hoylesella pleuritidis]ERK01680.1 polysaccharide pyruvyl transferase [Hoylesella pleuritidis F0068]